MLSRIALAKVVTYLTLKTSQSADKHTNRTTLCWHCNKMTYFSHLKRLKFIYFRVLTTRSLCTSSPNGFDKSSFMIKKLKDVYCHQILPLEKHYHFDKFHSPPMSDADFEANPMILLVGQYSTGKSSFIRWIASFRINLYFNS